MANSYLCVFLLLTGIFADNGEDEGNEDLKKISSGLLTSIERYPSLVQLEFYYPYVGFWHQSCAANVLNQFYVLSAAHCFYGASPTHRRIRAGSSTRHIGGVVINIVDAYIHPNYRDHTLDSDIAVARLASPLHYTNTIKPASVIYQNIRIPDRSEVRVAGWGKTTQGGFQSEVLLEITIYTINSQECARRNEEYFDPIYVTTNMICAGLLDIGGRDSCPGDSGGGLFYQDTLVGIVSWGRGCGNSYFPGVYTKISPFRAWIESIVRDY